MNPEENGQDDGSITNLFKEIRTEEAKVDNQSNPNNPEEEKDDKDSII